MSDIALPQESEARIEPHIEASAFLTQSKKEFRVLAKELTERGLSGRSGRTVNGIVYRDTTSSRDDISFNPLEFMDHEAKVGDYRVVFNATDDGSYFSLDIDTVVGHGKVKNELKHEGFGLRNGEFTYRMFDYSKPRSPNNVLIKVKRSLLDKKGTDEQASFVYGRLITALTAVRSIPERKAGIVNLDAYRNRSTPEPKT